MDIYVRLYDVNGLFRYQSATWALDKPANMLIVTHEQHGHHRKSFIPLRNVVEVMQEHGPITIEPTGKNAENVVDIFSPLAKPVPPEATPPT
jgi:hypothetical protein